MNIRVRGPAGQTTLREIHEDMTVAAFQALLAQETDVPVELQELLAGFPPKRLDLPASKEAVTVASLGLHAGDGLTVRQCAGAAVAEAAAPPASSDAQRMLNSDGDAAAGGSFSTAGMSEDEQLARAIAASLEDSTAPASASAALVMPRRLEPLPSPRPGVATLRSTSSAAPKRAPVFEPLPSGSAVVRRIVADDNSCLFSAVAYVQLGTRSAAAQLRSIVAEAVAADPYEWSEAVLGKSPALYCAWILDPKSWGGAIELSILSKCFGREIAAFDVQTQRVDLYGQDAGYPERVMLVYDGLHYDALAVALREGAPEGSDITVLPSSGPMTEQVMAGGARLVTRAHAARQFTDTANFALRCGICKVGLRGEKEAVHHAQATGHNNFVEY